MALSALPLLGRVIKDVESAEPLRVGVLEVLKFPLQQDVLLRDVAKDERDLGLVLRVYSRLAGDFVIARGLTHS